MAFELEGVEFIYEEGDSADEVSRWEASNTNVRSYHYPYTCTGVVIAGFGGTDTAFQSNRNISEHSVEEQIQAWIDYFEDPSECENIKCFISACTDNSQDEANTALKNLGFSSTRVEKRSKGHLYLWTRQLTQKVGVK